MPMFATSDVREPRCSATRTEPGTSLLLKFLAMPKSNNEDQIARCRHHGALFRVTGAGVRGEFWPVVERAIHLAHSKIEQTLIREFLRTSSPPEAH